MNWGLIGASTIAAEHMIGAIRACGGNPVWVVSGSPAHAQRFAAEHGIARASDDLAAMLADPGVEAVYISSTNEKHRSQALAAIAAGKHVICEKPLAMTVAEAAGMVRASRDAGVVFATNHHLRNAGSHQAIRAVIAQGRIGKVLSLRVHHAVHLPPHLQGWRINDAGAGGGVIPDITVHDADTVRFLTGEDPEKVVAQAGVSGMGRGVEDSVMSVWSLPSGAMVMAHESFTHRFAGSGVEVHGTDGSIFARGVMTQRPVGEVELVTAEGREIVPYSAHDLYAHGVAAFLGAARGEGQPAADGVDGVKSLAVAMAVREAAGTGRRVTVAYGGV
ncbi:Gfo/Idh/MocA family protein [Tabrizicola sp. BL-A-41-H6]|uniref:Gfo/Idh/MocA family protein n=1 Tax=Tabrizicola sp. BL-A-41-H6 TaxID=3421107 RepID=UPI003D66E880